MYSAMDTRPDISYAIEVASRYLEKPSSTHVVAAKRILKYIKGTLNRGIIYSIRIMLIIWIHGFLL